MTFVVIGSSKKVISILKSEVGSRKSTEKAEDIQFHLRNTFYIFMAVKYNFLYFHGCEILLFSKKLINIIFNQYFPAFHFFVYNKIAY